MSSEPILLSNLNDHQCRRCAWAESEWMRPYHDHEWGVPLHDDGALFEFLLLEGAQAGLSWDTILRKRANYRAAFDDFDPHKIAGYDEAKRAQLLADEGIVRNRLKINAAIENARATLQIQAEFGSLDVFLWAFVGGKPIQNSWQNLADIPVQTPESEAMSKVLKKRGFRFVGPTICYAFMQAVGMVNDHETGCYRWQELNDTCRFQYPLKTILNF